jgi:hypothetical protein
MHETSLVLTQVPELSDEAATQLLDLLHELTAALEIHYAIEPRRYQPDLFEDFDDEMPEF